jgi:DNA-binding response OmpR family regulator
VLKCAALTLDTARSKASLAGWPLALSRKEFAQLEALLRARPPP